MKKNLLIALTLLLALGFVFAGCGDDDGGGAGTEGNQCRGWVPPCDPECDYAAGEFCNAGTCQEAKTCDDGCGDDEYCNPVNGNCEAMPEEGEEIEPCNDGLECNWETGKCESTGDDGADGGDAFAACADAPAEDFCLQALCSIQEAYQAMADACDATGACDGIQACLADLQTCIENNCDSNDAATAGAVTECTQTYSTCAQQAVAGM